MDASTTIIFQQLTHPMKNVLKGNTLCVIQEFCFILLAANRDRHTILHLQFSKAWGFRCSALLARLPKDQVGPSTTVGANLTSRVLAVEEKAV